MTGNYPLRQVGLRRGQTILWLLISLGTGFLLTKTTTVQPEQAVFSGPVLSQEITSVPAGEIYSSIRIGQSFISPANALCRIDILLATYLRENDRDVIFHLRHAPEGEDLATIRFNASQVEDNTFHRFDFRPIPHSADQSFYFFLESPDSEPGNAITVWGVTQNVYEEGRAYRNHRPRGGELAFRVYAREESRWERTIEYLTKNAFQTIIFLLYSALTFCLVGLLRHQGSMRSATQPALEVPEDVRTINTSLKFPKASLAQSAKWLLIGVTLLAISLRIWGINFGLPYLYHPDEPVGVRIAQRMFKTGDLNPQFYHWPSLTFYINALAYIPYYLVGKSMGVFHSPADIPSPIMLAMGVGQTPMPTTWLLGRFLTVTFGSAAVVLAFLIGRKLTNNTAVGLLAGIMMAISPTNVAHSRLITPDTFTVFFVLLSFWGSVQVLQQGKPWHYIIAGIGSGLAASTKYTGALIVLPLILAHLLRHGLKGMRERNLYSGLVFSVVAFLATTPFALLDYQKFLTDLQFDAQHYSTGHAGMEGNTLNWYLAYLWRVEGPVALLAVLEILRGIYARSKRSILLSVFPLVYFAFISSLVVRNDRTLLPLTPFLFLLASSLVVNLFRQTNTRRLNTRKALTLAAVVLVIVSLTVPFLRTVKNNFQLTTVDSRETARIWIAHNLPSGARIAIESYAPYVDPQRFSVQGFGRMIDQTPEWYIANGFQYLIFSQGMFGRFYREPDRYSNDVSQYEKLFRAFDMVKTLTDGGYEVRIYHVTER